MERPSALAADTLGLSYTAKGDTAMLKETLNPTAIVWIYGHREGQSLWGRSYLPNGSYGKLGVERHVFTDRKCLFLVSGSVLQGKSQLP